MPFQFAVSRSQRMQRVSRSLRSQLWFSAVQYSRFEYLDQNFFLLKW